MKREAVQMGTCGTHTVRLRPMLIFEEAHSKFNELMHSARGCLLIFALVSILMSRLNKVLGSM